jgi:N-acetyl sugar amidotransferase
MNRCKLCVMPDTRPDHAFVDGVCPACINHANNPEIDWDARDQELLNLLERHNGRCIVPSSGGKDSTYQAIKLKELGADPLVVTATTCHLTEIGRKNIDNLARFATTIEVSPNKTVRARLNRLGLEMVGDISWPEHAAIFSTPFMQACKNNIPLIFYGENPQNQYGGPQGSEEAKTMTRRWTQEFGGFLGLRPDDFVGVEGITAKDMGDYVLPDQRWMDDVGVEAHFLGQYIPWDSRYNAQVAIDHGMIARKPCEANWWDFENLDNLDTYWHDHAMWRKYGYGRGCTQISVDIREGLIGRKEALIWVEKHDGQVVDKYMGHSIYETAERIGLTKDQMWEYMDNFTNWSIHERP